MRTIKVVGDLWDIANEPGIDSMSGAVAFLRNHTLQSLLHLQVSDVQETPIMVIYCLLVRCFARFRLGTRITRYSSIPSVDEATFGADLRCKSSAFDRRAFYERRDI